ncbi:hypothetical protein FDG46_01595 [Clostridium botulinum]|uniref:Uncharacterized protein n=1 Tax=Clostridium botulinum (strain Hall / ATCC 3502 / NCTC 13319 / Type A) TaxID=441771 RepID=A5HZ84_CLOBH|nr:hypothetical protein DB732_03035 [Clostridium botulinum]CAL82093.1 hypothetical protein CBO0540 [Clostridium botulinum A str. ATCC 3502]AWB29278.1 hypothetical protein DBN47_03040 [Clostridium botulinum]EGT5614170.1 hypothetical protein [Clostridium botulinum]EGT5620871.1 hypothetical protein [Clostridium botulinum]
MDVFLSNNYEIKLEEILWDIPYIIVIELIIVDYKNKGMLPNINFMI